MAASSFTCELTILRAENMDSLPEGGNLFVRCYLSAAGKKERIHLDTRLVDDPAACSWDQTFSIQCSGAEESIDELKQDSLILELRRKRRVRATLLGGSSSSKLLGRAEVPWRTAFNSPDMEIENWVPVVPLWDSGNKEGVKPPYIRVALKLRFGPAKAGEISARQQKRRKRAGESGCGCERRCDQPWGCGNGEEYYHAFAMAAALEAL
ncbi:hypothetical protein CRG98_020892 [Punica granatum]|nr:hypothetical protein CRG98_020892 [Punica granatum]